MKRKLLPLLAIAFVVAVISTGIFYGLIMGKLRSSSAPKPQQTILVAARSLERGTVLEKSHVKIAPRGEKAPAGGFAHPDQVEGLTVLKPVPEDQPITPEVLSARSASGGLAYAIPAGMRAVSLRVSDSPGIVSILRAGHKVDVQAVRARNTQTGAETELRTVLQNVEVLGVQSDATQGRPAATAVVTVLATPEQGDVLIVADAATRIRLWLRNPTDEEKNALGNLLLNAIFQAFPSSARPRVLRVTTAGQDRAPAIKRSSSSPRAEMQVQLRVRIAEAAPTAFSEMTTRLLAPRHSGALQVCAFPPGWDLESAVEGFRARRLLEILSSSSLLTANNREVSVQAGAQWTPRETTAGDRAGVRIQFLPLMSTPGKVRLRVQPEITSSRAAGVAIRKIETELELSDGQSFLVSGLVEGRGGPSLIARLFPGRSEAATDGELVVLATPQFLRSAPIERRSTAALKK